MTINRERKSHYTGWEIGGCGDSCFGERPDERVWNFYRKYAGRGGVKPKQGGFCPFCFLFDHVIMEPKEGGDLHGTTD